MGSLCERRRKRELMKDSLCKINTQLPTLDKYLRIAMRTVYIVRSSIPSLFWMICDNNHKILSLCIIYVQKGVSPLLIIIK